MKIHLRTTLIALLYIKVIYHRASCNRFLNKGRRKLYFSSLSWENGIFDIENLVVCTIRPEQNRTDRQLYFVSKCLIKKMWYRGYSLSKYMILFCYPSASICVSEKCRPIKTKTHNNTDLFWCHYYGRISLS